MCMFEYQVFAKQWTVSRETIEKLIIYQKLLEKWQPKINLVSPNTMTQIWSRHFADSLQLLEIAPDAKIWADIGTGAGFPGLVLAIAMQSHDSNVHLFESNGKKCAFLREVIRETGCRATVHDGRVEHKLNEFNEKSNVKLDVITARALAPLSQLIIYAEQLLISGTRSLFLKGQDVELELRDASLIWDFSSHLYKSQIDSRGCVVEISHLSKRKAIERG